MTLSIRIVELPYCRGPGDEECEDYNDGPALLNANCETDGHYLCSGCVYNVHRINDHICSMDPCYFPGRMMEAK